MLGDLQRQGYEISDDPETADVVSLAGPTDRIKSEDVLDLGATIVGWCGPRQLENCARLLF